MRNKTSSKDHRAALRDGVCSRQTQGRHGGAPSQVRVTGLAPFRPFRPGIFLKTALDALPAVLDDVMPLRSAHRADLPDAVQSLSRILTSERGGLDRPYWTNPRFVSAYLRYFLPWNLLRLHRLFCTLPLPSPEEDGSVFMDLGSGPLSVPMALWLTREDWRRAKVRLVCADTSPHPMELGERVFRKLAGQLNEPFQWEVRLLRKPLLQALAAQRVLPKLVTAANVLNEWEDRSTGADDTLADRMGDLAELLARALDTGSAAVFVEPGTRLGGTLCANLRAAALNTGLVPAAPCTHCSECPLLGQRDRGWCHLHEMLAEDAAPAWLTRLALQARLPKQTLSSACMMLVHKEEDSAGTTEQVPRDVKPIGGVKGTKLVARLLSDAFLVPKYGLARYACSSRGLLLVPHSARFASGARIDCLLPDKYECDPKSGALVAEVVGSDKD